MKIEDRILGLMAAGNVRLGLFTCLEIVTTQGVFQRMMERLVTQVIRFATIVSGAYI